MGGAIQRAVGIVISSVARSSVVLVAMVAMIVVFALLFMRARRAQQRRQMQADEDAEIGPV